MALAFYVHVHPFACMKPYIQVKDKKEKGILTKKKGRAMKQNELICTTANHINLGHNFHSYV